MHVNTSWLSGCDIEFTTISKFRSERMRIWKHFPLFMCLEARIKVRAVLPLVPDYVLTYAPLVYLDQNELYLPSDIQSQLNNTAPALNLTVLAASTLPSPLTLSNLSSLNALGNCTSFASCPLYLTSTTNISTNPPWLYGVLPDAVTHETVGAKSCAVLVYDHSDGTGTVDAFYMYFYAFNRGLNVLGQVLGNHVGDWEHSMVRFVNGTPVAVWLSQHDYGQALSYNTLSKLGLRPLIYSAIGSHANFAVPGTHSRLIATLTVNDTTSPGPLWDPVRSAYFYNYTPVPTSSPSSDIFPFVFTPATTLNASINAQPAPYEWLSYYGRWGDARYPDSDPRQLNFANLNISWRYEDGPTGPADKGLVRRDVCPDVTGRSCVTTSTLPSVSGSSVPVTVVRSSSVASGSVTGTLTAGSSSSATSPVATASGTGRSGATVRCAISSGLISLCLTSVMIQILLA